MKNFLFFLFILFSNLTFSQDLIVTNQSDSLNCKIKYEKDDYVHFVFKDKKINKIRETLLHKNQIKDIKRGYYPTPEIVPNENYKENKFRFEASVGAGLMLGEIEEVNQIAQEHTEELSRGLDLSANLAYFLKKLNRASIGFGAKCSFYHSKNTVENIYVSNGIGDLEGEINTFFAAPMGLISISKPYSKVKMVFGVAIGLAYHERIDEVKGANLKVKQYGTNLATAMDLNLDYMISERMAIGINLSMTGISFSELNVEENGRKDTIEAPDGEFFSASRVSIGIGLRFY